jgi:aspartyl-tRNA(Asn)/glutamyl-tRNA(Gln) amidotransferase subunit C
VSLSRQDVEKVSLLGRLRFGADELDQMTAQLAQIVGYVEQLSELDTSAVPPLAHAVEIANVFADDRERPSVDRESILANAPKRDEECYRVPAVLGD